MRDSPTNKFLTSHHVMPIHTYVNMLLWRGCSLTTISERVVGEVEYWSVGQKA
jgi:hypothetical protein